jgi:hypothetical protein
VALAGFDGERQFRDILDEANRANASFYPLDPLGLRGVDLTGSGSGHMASVRRDRSVLDNLRTLAENTDGMAIVNSNNLAAGLQRIVQDLSSYYLLGYYSTNTTLDGRFRGIKVRVNRPGVDVRARRGYKAASAEEVEAGRKAAETPNPEESPAVASALGLLSRLRPNAPLYVHAVLVAGAGSDLEKTVDSRSDPTLWVVAEVVPAPGEAEAWRGGGRADVAISTRDGEPAATASATLAAGARSLLVKVPLRGAAPAGYVIRVRLRPAGDGAEALTELVDVPASGEGPGPALLYRRGPSTGNQFVPAAGFRYRRTERVRLDVPVPAGTGAASGRLLDRTGAPLEVPVSVASRDEGGVRWIAVEATLAPLTAGDYLIELVIPRDGGQARVLTPLRIER